MSKSESTFQNAQDSIGITRTLSGGLPATPAMPPASPNQPEGNEILQTVRSLRSIQGNFSDQRVPDDKLETIIVTSVRA